MPQVIQVWSEGNLLRHEETVATGITFVTGEKTDTNVYTNPVMILPDPPKDIKARFKERSQFELMLSLSGIEIRRETQFNKCYVWGKHGWEYVQPKPYTNIFDIARFRDLINGMFTCKEDFKNPTKLQKVFDNTCAVIALLGTSGLPDANIHRELSEMKSVEECKYYVVIQSADALRTFEEARLTIFSPDP